MINYILLFMQAQKAADVKAEDVSADIHQDKHSDWYKWILEYTGNFKTRVDFTTALYNVPIVLSHTRRYDNFARANQDPKLVLPLKGGDDRWMADLDRTTLFTYIFFVTTDGAVPVMMNCLGLAFFRSVRSRTLIEFITMSKLQALHR
jgi:hypothetical protein